LSAYRTRFARVASGVTELRIRKPGLRDRYRQNAENLPPLSPRFVSLKQELFTRQFEL
jgi:hypothetical protein